MKCSPYRRIVRKTWTKRRFRELTVEKKLLLFYVWTSPAAINPGIYYVGLPTIADELGVSERKTKRLVQELIADNWFHYDFSAKVIFFSKWAEYDKPRNASVVTSYLAHVNDLPDTNLKEAFLETLLPFAHEHGVTIPDELAVLCGHKSESMGAQNQMYGRYRNKNKGTESTNSGCVHTNASLSDEELDHKNREHWSEILQRTLAYYNRCLENIGERTFCRDVLTPNEIKDFEACLRQGADLEKCRAVIDGCFACKYNRENHQLRFGTIFKPDRVGRYAALAKSPEVDDLGNEIAKQVSHETTRSLVKEVCGGDS